MNKIAWSAKVSKQFLKKAILICDKIKIKIDDLMSCIAFESGETFSASVLNAAGSGATGLIQFMPQTATALGTTTDKLSKMTPIEQLDYVYEYFLPWKNKIHNLEDLYMSILWPSGIGKSSEYVLFDKNDIRHPKRYIQNKGLDFNKDGVITKHEACAGVHAKLIKGYLNINARYTMSNVLLDNIKMKDLNFRYIKLVSKLIMHKIII